MRSAAALEAALHKTVDLFEGLVILTERAFGRVFFPQLTPDERHVCADAALSSGIRTVCTAGAAGFFAGQEHLVGTVKQGNIIVPACFSARPSVKERFHCMP